MNERMRIRESVRVGLITNARARLMAPCPVCKGRGVLVPTWMKLPVTPEYARRSVCPECGGRKAVVLRETRSRNVTILAARAILGQSLEYADALSGTSVKQCSVGTDDTTPTQTDTALGAQLAIKNITSWDNSNSGDDPPEFIASTQFSISEGNGLLTEGGLWLSDGSTLFAHTLFNQATITDVTQANPGVVTAAAHGFANGDLVVINGVVGMTQLNGNQYTVANKAANTFELSGTDTSGFTAYSSGGTATLRYNKTGSSVFQVDWSIFL